MATKTITLTGAEVAVTGLDGAHAHIRNDSTDTIYAAKMPGITAGADGVASIPAGQADTLRGISGKVYLLGTGSALIQSDDYVESPFKASVTPGSVTDIISRAVSNPNLLINPDFRINQCGESIYNINSDSYVCTVDAWKTKRAGNNIAQIAVEEDGIVLAPLTPLVEFIESSGGINGRVVTMSSCVDGTVVAKSFVWSAGSAYTIIFDQDEFRMSFIDNSNARYVQIFNYSATKSKKVSWVKLELGSVATSFCPPDPATELAKCQRYYQIRSAGDIDPVDLRPSMATIKDIKQRSDGNYEYIAEL